MAAKRNSEADIVILEQVFKNNGFPVFLSKNFEKTHKKVLIFKKHSVILSVNGAKW